jgi:energy-coupling factor transporter ATP-binding protein EcfA2
MEMNYTDSKKWIKPTAMLLINVSLVLATIVFSMDLVLAIKTVKSTPTSLLHGFIYTATRLLELSLFAVISYIVLSAFHIFIVSALTLDLSTSLLNRVCTFFFLLSITGWGDFSQYLFILEAAGWISFFILLFISRIMFWSSKWFKSSGIGKIKGFIEEVKESKALGLNRFSYLPTLLASHAVSFSTTLVLLILFGRMGIIVEDRYFYYLPMIIPPILLLPVLIRRGCLHYQEALILGITSGYGLLGLTPLITYLGSPVKEVSVFPSRVFYRAGGGVYVGELESILVCSRGLVAGGGESEKHVFEPCVWRRSRGSIFVKLEDLNTPHVVVVGVSGSGKTTLSKHLILESTGKYGSRFIVIDPHGEYRDLVERTGEGRVIDASKHALNPLYLGRASPRERALQLSHVVSTVFKLGLLQRRMLEELIFYTYESRGIIDSDPSTWSREPPSLADLVKVCEELLSSKPEYHRVLPYLTLLRDNLPQFGWLSIDELMRGNIVVDLSKLPSDFARALYIDTLIYLLISEMYRVKKAERIQVVFEEARGLMPRKLSRELLLRLFTESRKFGFSIIVVTQEIRGVPRALINNAGLRVFFLLNDPKSIEEASRIIAGAESRERQLAVSRVLRTLPPHAYIVHATGLEEVLLLKSPTLNTTP